MRVGDLGTLVVEVDGVERSFGGTKQAVVLALLTLNANRRVSVDELVEAAWGGRPTSAASVENQVWRLRRALASTDGTASSSIAHDARGYRLTIDPDDIDSLLFEKLIRSTEVLLLAGHPDAALGEADRALSLWRGRPYEILSDVMSTTAAVGRLEALHVQLHEQRVAALIGLGRLEQALDQLETLIAANPYREHLWAQRMTALAGAGRTVEALASYQQVRVLLAEETGLDPGPELQELHQRILNHEVSTQHAPAPLTAVHLPPQLTRLIGRDEDTERLGQLVLRQPLVTISGPGGTGKTRLAVTVAASQAAAFVDGVWFVDLSSVSTPALVVDLLASALGLAGSTITDPLQAVLTFIGRRRILLLLDNCEHVLDVVYDTVEIILGSCPNTAVLATSREPLGLAAEAVWPLAPLSVIPRRRDGAVASPAARLFVERAQTADVSITFDEEQLRRIEQICRSVDGLPLAIELAAARTRLFSLAEIADQVATDPSRLARIGRSREDHRHDLYQSIEWSYRLLPPDEQALHRQLSILPGPFTMAAAVGVAGADSYAVADGLLSLSHRSLLTARAPELTHATSSFSQLATVRSHAQRRLIEAREYDAASRRRDAWVKELLSERPRLGSPDAPAWYDLLEENYPVIRASLQQAVRPDGDAELVQLGSNLVFFWYFRSRLIEGCRWLDAVHASGPRSLGGFGDVMMRMRLTGSLLLRFESDRARPHFDACRGQLSGVSDDLVILTAEALVSIAASAWSCRAFDVVTAAGQELEQLALRTSDEHVRLFADTVACMTALPHGNFGAVAHQAEELFRRARPLENLFVLWASALMRCVAATETRHPADAIAWTRQASELQSRLGPGGSKAFLEALGNCLSASQDFAGAIRFYAAARKETVRTGSTWPNHPQTRELFDWAKEHVPEPEFRQAWQAGETLSVDRLADLASRSV